MSHRLAAALISAALLIPLAACGGSDDPGGAGGQGGAAPDGGAADATDVLRSGGNGKAGDCEMLVGPTVCFHYELTGEVTASGTSSGLVATNNGTSYDSCAQWAKGEPDGDGQLRLGMPSGSQYAPGDKFGGLTGNIIVNYTGPGTYAKKDLSGQGSPSGVITPSSTKSFILVSDSTGSATIEADGSGRFTFDDLGTGQYGHPETLSGEVSWTCHNP